MKINDKNFCVRFILTVWGQDYIDTFFSVTLPSLLQEGNLPYFCKNFRSIFHIVSDEEGVALIEQNPMLDLLRKHGEVVVEAGSLTRDHKFDKMTELQNVGVRAAYEHGNALGFIFVDAVWARNSFIEFVDALKKGKRVVASFNFRTNRENIIEVLKEKGYVGKGVLDIGHSELVDIALDNLHSLMMPHFWQGENGFKFCGHLFRKLEGDASAVAVNTFLPVPYVIIPRKKVKEIPYSPDVVGISNTYHDVFLTMTNPNVRDYYISRDSNTHFNIELSKPQRTNFQGPPADVRAHVLWAEQHTNELHSDFFKFNIAAAGENAPAFEANSDFEAFKAEILKQRARSTWHLYRNDWRQLFARATYYHFKSQYAPLKVGPISNWILKRIAQNERPWEFNYDEFEDGSYQDFLDQKAAEDLDTVDEVA